MFIAKCFLFALVIDDSEDNMSKKARWILGYFVAILAFIIIVWNTLVLIYKLFEYWNLCRIARKNKFVNIEGMMKDEDLE